MDSVIHVSKGGRGFVVEGGGERFVITAGHCLTKLPPCHGSSYTSERTYKNLLGPLGGRCGVWAECVFADPVADLAILGCPDNQELSKQADAYEALVESVTPLPIADLPLKSRRIKRQVPKPFRSQKSNRWNIFYSLPTWKGNGCLLSLDGRWFSCRLTASNKGWLSISDAEKPITGGMSGSPIVNHGAAIGIISVSGGGPNLENHREGSGSFLARRLPRWFLDEIGLARHGR